MKIVMVCHKYGVSIDDPCCYPLGFMYISAVLKQLGHQVKVMNFNLWDYDLSEELKGQDAALFTGFEEFLPAIIRDAAVCREMGVRTIIGGALATFKPQEMLQHVDAVVVGEGETAIIEALHFDGVAQKYKPNLGTLPTPDYDGFGIEEYHRRHTVRYMGVLTSRGCPYSCRFCAQTCSFQFRSLTAVFAEIDTYRAAYGVELIIFNDNTLNLRKDRFLAICAGMKERGLPWSAAIRVDVFDEEMACAAKESGCRYFVVGVESFIDAKLTAMDKRITSAQIKATIDILHKYEIGYHGNVLVGLHGETFDGILEEVAAIPDGYNIFPVLVQPFVGTEYQGRSITDDEARQLSEAFGRFAESAGMTMYREAA